VGVDMEVLGFFAKLFEKSAITLFPIAVATGIILFSTPEFVETIGITKIHTDYKTVIGIVFLFSSGTVLTIWGVKFYNIVSNWFKKFLVYRAWVKTLGDLTAAEKSILRVFIIRRESVIYENLGEGIMLVLELKNIVLRSSYQSNSQGYFPYAMQPWALEYLLVPRQSL